MSEPLALVVYEKLLPGSQVVNRLHDLNYRVETVADAARLVECAEQMKPLIVLADLENSRSNVSDAISRLKKNEATRHLPVIAFTSATESEKILSQAKAGGATLCVTDAALLNHLHQLLEQALQLD
jgi:CheY-like chemotaxis protein